MGGCRCTFGECKNSTTNMPGMHFFHFPYKDPERCKKWASYSGRIDFLRLPHSQLRNKTICGIHFAEKFFMNFLKESLTRNAIPTLQKDANGQMVEVHVDENELAALVYPLQSKQQTIDLPENNMSRSTQSGDDIESMSSVSFEDSDAIECEKTKVLVQAMTRKAAVDEQRASIELPINTYGSAKRVPSADLTTIPRKRILVKQYKSDKASSSIKVLNSHQLVQAKRSMDVETSNSGSVNNHPPSRRNQGASAPQVNQREDNCPNTDEVDIVMIDPDGNTSFTQPAQSVQITDESTTTIDKELYLHTMAEHTKQIDELKKMLAEKLESERSGSQQSTSVSASSSSDVRGELKTAKGPAMTKIQLFNGIRKYLNPSMVALLRMEIFGGAERDYRPDEKQIAKELFSLNASVYDYMREEWRFRLPSKAQVESWLKEPDDDDISEFF